MRGCYDLVAWLETERSHRNIKRVGTIGAADTMLDADER